jgi:hypothetical protein
MPKLQERERYQNDLQMTTYEIIQFRLFQMPCCGQLLCWVNPRIPNYCPECGAHVILKLKSGEHTRINDDRATLKVDQKKP